MFGTTIYIILSVLLVSAVSLIGILTFLVKSKNLEKILLYLVSFSVGALFGDVFIHLLPQAFKDSTGYIVGLYVLSGILLSFVLEKVIHWRHCHIPSSRQHPHHLAYMNLVGDAMHNFIDGLIIAGGYFVSIPAGIATTVAVLLHEIPHEAGNFGVLIYGGFTRARALLFNFITALTALLGAGIGILLSQNTGTLIFLVPFAAGNLIYIAGTDLIPELHKGTCENFSVKESVWQLLAMMFGIAVMTALLLLD